jgi:hypothetical protein
MVKEVKKEKVKSVAQVNGQGGSLVSWLFLKYKNLYTTSVYAKLILSITGKIY